MTPTRRWSISVSRTRPARRRSLASRRPRPRSRPAAPRRWPAGRRIDGRRTRGDHGPGGAHHTAPSQQAGRRSRTTWATRYAGDSDVRDRLGSPSWDELPDRDPQPVAGDPSARSRRIHPRRDPATTPPTSGDGLQRRPADQRRPAGLVGRLRCPPWWDARVRRARHARCRQRARGRLMDGPEPADRDASPRSSSPSSSASWVWVIVGAGLMVATGRTRPPRRFRPGAERVVAGRARRHPRRQWLVFLRSIQSRLHEHLVTLESEVAATELDMPAVAATVRQVNAPSDRGRLRELASRRTRVVVPSDDALTAVYDPILGTIKGILALSVTSQSGYRDGVKLLIAQLRGVPDLDALLATIASSRRRRPPARPRRTRRLRRPRRPPHPSRGRRRRRAQRRSPAPRRPRAVSRPAARRPS